MRCSSCEAVLDRFLEGTLAPREMMDVSEHLGRCGSCARLLEEVKVVDALLLTTRVPELPGNFTFAVMAETISLPAPQPHRHRVWSFIAVYLTAAWVVAAALFFAAGANAAKLGPSLMDVLNRISGNATAAVAGVSHGAPALATFSLSVLGIDLALACLAAVVYVVIRPRLAAHLASASEAQ